jgi:hypothetical protein
MLTLFSPLLCVSRHFTTLLASNPAVQDWKFARRFLGFSCAQTDERNGFNNLLEGMREQPYIEVTFVRNLALSTKPFPPVLTRSHVVRSCRLFASCLSVLPSACIISTPTGWIGLKFNIGCFIKSFEIQIWLK